MMVTLFEIIWDKNSAHAIASCENIKCPTFKLHPPNSKNTEMGVRN